MSLFERIGEQYNPGPTGGVQFEAGSTPSKPLLLTLSLFLVALGLFAAWIYLVVSVWAVKSFMGLLIWGLLTVIYLILGYYGRPQPDLTNMGLLGGIIDNPFRYSDDINRYLLIAAILLLPGQFISRSFVGAAVSAIATLRKS